MKLLFSILLCALYCCAADGSSYTESEITPYLLPEKHPATKVLDAIFTRSRASADTRSLLKAGFTIVSQKKQSFVTIVRHPKLPGYLFKLYLDTEMRSRDGFPNYTWLLHRCRGAALLRSFIQEREIRHFLVPDKWLYLLPTFPEPTGANPQPFILIETDMPVSSKEKSKHAWETKITPRHLEELYAILSEGHGSVHILGNIPYMSQGKFALIDTEYYGRIHKLHKVNHFLSKKMQLYWESIIR